MGLSGSVRFLLPVILPEASVSTALLRKCFDAVDMRQNVVHNGQRDVDRVKLQSALESIRELCLVLESLQQH